MSAMSLLAPIGAPAFARVEKLVTVDAFEPLRCHAAEEESQTIVGGVADSFAITRLVAEVIRIYLIAKPLDGLTGRSRNDCAFLNVQCATFCRALGDDKGRAITTRSCGKRLGSTVRILVPKGDFPGAGPLV